MLTERFRDALVYAFDLHREQRRKVSGVPYVAHLLGVAGIALENGATEDEAIAALLHDAIEDQGGAATGEAIRRRFGDAVADVVVGCTDAFTVPKPPWRQRKEDYIARLESEPASVRLISASDKVHNARAIVADHRQCGAEVWQRFNGGREGTLWYYRALVDVYRRGGPAILAKELDRLTCEMELLP
jgi:GTP pyrophosphokinase